MVLDESFILPLLSYKEIGDNMPVSQGCNQNEVNVRDILGKALRTTGIMPFFRPLMSHLSLKHSLKLTTNICL